MRWEQVTSENWWRQLVCARKVLWPTHSVSISLQNWWIPCMMWVCLLMPFALYVRRNWYFLKVNLWKGVVSIAKQQKKITKHLLCIFVWTDSYIFSISVCIVHIFYGIQYGSICETCIGVLPFCFIFSVT